MQCHACAVKLGAKGISSKPYLAIATKVHFPDDHQVKEASHLSFVKLTINSVLKIAYA